MVWIIQVGDDPPIQLSEFGMAVECMVETIRECRLPDWRTRALLQQAENMPRAGFAFTDNKGNLVKVEMTR